MFKGNTKSEWRTLDATHTVIKNNNIRQNTETMSIDVKNSFQQPLPLFHYDRYYFNKEEEEDEERKRKNERRFRRMLYSNFYAMHYIINNSNYNNQLRSFPLYHALFFPLN